MTKSELIAALEASHVSYQKLAAEHESLRAAFGRLSSDARIDVARAVLKASQPSAYREACAKARELAMRSGKAVRVG